MSFMGGGNIATGPGSGLRFASTRGRIQGSATSGVNYPSPFFDVAHTYLPVTVKALFKWCRYYFLTNPLINATVFKLSEYPVTDIIIEHPDKSVIKKWTEYFQDHLRYRAFQVESGLDFHAYGNACISLGFPFKKFLFCGKCDWRDEAGKCRANWSFTNYQFRLTCPRCGTIGDASAKDNYYKNPSGIKTIRWNPEDIEITYNDITGDYTYFYTIPATVRNDVVIGRKDVVESLPQVFIQAMREQKGVIFSKENFFHMRRPTLATQDRGWGTPLLLPVLKDTFYLQIMKKAQECVAPSTLIETSRGLVPASEVQVGDFVRTHLGGYKPISGRAVRPMVDARGDYGVEVTLTGLRQMPSTFSDNHPLWILRCNDVDRRSDTPDSRRSSYVLRNPDLYEFTWVDAGAARAGDYIGYPTTRSRKEQKVDIAKYVDFVRTDAFVYSGVSEVTARAFEALERGEHVQHDNAGRVAKRRLAVGGTPKRAARYLELDEDLAYVAGWYLGDGSIGIRRVDFSMGPDDDGVELQAAISRVFGGTFSSYSSPKSRGWTLSAFDTIFSEFMGGWISGNATQKRIPQEILNAPDLVVLAFLRGYLEADGYTELRVRNDERIAVCCSNKQLCYQLWSLLLTFGCISTVAERTSYDTVISKLDGTEQFLEGGRPTFHWTLCSSSARRFSALLRGVEAETVTSGKSGFFVHGYFASKIQQVEVVPCTEVVSFEVLDDHTFCTPGMATHNSILLEHIVPLRALFPQAGSGSSDPYSTVNLIDWRDQIAAEIARWRYDCVSPDTDVETLEGFVRADTVQVGDQLRNHLGESSTVEKIWRRPLRVGERGYLIKVAGNAAARVSEGHPFLACKGWGLTSEARFIRAKDLCIGDYIGTPKKSAAAQEFNASDDFINSRDYLWRRVEAVEVTEIKEVIGFQVSHETVVRLEDDTEAHGTFCLRVGACANTNYIPILPLPIGSQTIGGDGKALMLTQEIMQWSEHIMMGMGVPREFLLGGLSYAGTNVSMKMLENMFLGYILNQKALARYIMKQVASFLDWPEAKIRFKPFKLADDLQRKALDLQLNAAGKLSDTTLLASSDYNEDDELALMIKESDGQLEAQKKKQIAMANIQGEAQSVMMKWQMKAQQTMQTAAAAPPAPGEPGGVETGTGAGAPGGQPGQPGQTIPAEMQAPAATGPAQAPGAAPAGPQAPADYVASMSSQLSSANRMQTNEQGGPSGSMNVDLPTMAMAQARLIAVLPKNMQALAIQNVELQSPELGALVKQMLASLSQQGGGEDGGSSGAGIDMRPAPEQRPARRANGSG